MKSPRTRSARTAVLGVRMTEADRNALIRVAARRGVSVAALVVSIFHTEDAGEALEKRLGLSPGGAAAFAISEIDALLDDASIAPRIEDDALYFWDPAKWTAQRAAVVREEIERNRKKAAAARAAGQAEAATAWEENTKSAENLLATLDTMARRIAAVGEAGGLIKSALQSERPVGNAAIASTIERVIEEERRIAKNAATSDDPEEANRRAVRVGALETIQKGMVGFMNPPKAKKKRSGRKPE